jgi:D-threonate/D-erythronate kinase
MIGPRALLVTADDSTGATEAGAACADAGLQVDVVPFGVMPESVTDGCVVVDLRSRHIDAGEARTRIMATTGAGHRMHKIDSTLRGNWPAELQALVDTGRRVVLIPSHPRAGRVCVGGVVHVDGVPVAESDLANDPRLPVRNSRPSEFLDARELSDAGQLADWLAGSSPGAVVVDASTLAEIGELTSIAFGPPDVVVAGPASVVGAVAAISAPDGASPKFPDPLLPGPVVVVCASLHPVSRAQIARMAAAGFDVVTSPETRDADPERVARGVAERAHQRVADSAARSVMLIGGDTAEAFIGDNVVHVFGSLDVGVSLGEARIRGRALRLASKPGGFGTPNTLLDLVMR